MSNHERPVLSFSPKPFFSPSTACISGNTAAEKIVIFPAKYKPSFQVFQMLFWSVNTGIKQPFFLTYSAITELDLIHPSNNSDVHSLSVALVHS